MLAWLAIAAQANEPFLEADATAIWQVEEPGGYFGWGVADVDDVDGDGVRDVVTADPFGAGYTGSTVVLSGRDGSEHSRYQGPTGGLDGYSVADAGDVDGDGVTDVASGAPGADAVHVLSGLDGSLIATLSAGDPGASLGSAVAGMGDVDGDGTSDVAAGAETAGDGATSGRVYLFSGADGSVLWSVDGAAGEMLGSGTGRVDDTDGDGAPDLAVGARGAGQGGEVWLLSGADGSVRFREGDPDGGGQLGQFFVAGLADLDGDGTADLYGGDYANPALGPATGRAFVWSGADGHALFTFTGSAAGQGLGPGRGAGDVDGDGIEDLVVGSWRNSDGAAQAGRVDVFSGADGSVLRTVTSTTAGEDFGFDAVGLGDVDGDATVDLLVSAATGNRVYLVGTVAAPDTGAPVVSGDQDTASAAEDGGGCGCATGGPAGTWLAPCGVLGAVRRRRPRPPQPVRSTVTVVPSNATG